MPRDPYEVLGVARTATADQIREAHRKLAKKFHPDLNKTPEAAARFKEVQEAYDLLSDQAKRSQFDRFGHAGPGVGGGSGGPGFGGAGGWGNVDPSTFEEIFGDFMGGGRRGDTRRGTRAGEDLESEITVDFMTAALGGVRHVTLENGHQGMDVRIPAGIESGGQLRLRGKGAAGVGGGPAGDMVLRVTVASHPWFRREGLDILVDVPVSIAECALGTSVQVPLLEGTATLRVPPGTGSGKRLRLKGKGVQAKSGAGDLYAVIRVEAPKTLSEDDRAALERMKASEPDPRAGAPWNTR